MNQRNGADLLCETLLANDVNVCFANPGTSEMHFVAALDRQPKMRCVLGLFEGVVTGAADGFARMAERPASTLLHTGPGLANGLANLHNARRANSPMVNIVGDHASFHLPFDAPLTSDIDSLARPMSHWVGRSASADDVGAKANQAIAQANCAPGRIATFILPADHAWNPTQVAASKATPLQAIPANNEKALARAAEVLLDAGVSSDNTVILLAGKALRQDALQLASQISVKTGAKLLAQQANARVERGLGRVMIDRVPYVVDKALQVFANTRRIILIGSKAPVGFFGYPGKPSSMLPADCEIIVAASPAEPPLAVLKELAQRTGSTTSNPMLAQARTLDLPQAELTPLSIAQSVVAMLPEHAIICDESVSSGRDFFPLSYHAAPHDYLQITGGAIGVGLPLATGAAIAAPGRKVVSLQADGSAMYTVQALWTQAREKLNVVTIIFSNRRYNILLGELKDVGAGLPGENAQRMLNIDSPSLNWVQIANGMGVEAARATTAQEFNHLLEGALRMQGPFLIEACIP
jgi:acetolactate synthase I/II/III large subunit